MREYAVKLAVCAITVGLISSLCTENYRKYVNGAGSVLFLLILLLPLRSFNGFNAQDISKRYEAMAETYISENTLSEIRQNIANEHLTALLKEMGYDCSVETEIKSQDNSLLFSFVTVKLRSELTESEYGQIIGIITDQTAVPRENIAFILS